MKIVMIANRIIFELFGIPASVHCKCGLWTEDNQEHQAQQLLIIACFQTYSVRGWICVFYQEQTLATGCNTAGNRVHCKCGLKIMRSIIRTNAYRYPLLQYFNFDKHLLLDTCI